MSNNKQSSVEWLMQQIALKYGAFQAIAFYEENFKEFQQAKEMHRDEIEKAHARGEVTGFGRVNHPQFYADKTPENYYNETFGGNNERNLSE